MVVIDAAATFARETASTAWHVVMAEDVILGRSFGSFVCLARRFSIPLVPSLAL